MIHKNYRCEFYFIRHGQSKSNATPGMAAGENYDAPLTDLGIHQATALGERFRKQRIDFDRIYSSSLTRAIQTTNAMLSGMEKTDKTFELVDEIIEQQIKGWRGVPISEAITTDVEISRAVKGKDFVPPDGESIREVQRRASNWIENEFIYNREFCSRPVSSRIAVVGHGNTSRAIFQYIMGFDERLIHRLGVDNTSISRFIFDSGGWSVACLNDKAHLEGNLLGANETAV